MRIVPIAPTPRFNGWLKNILMGLSGETPQSIENQPCEMPKSGREADFLKLAEKMCKNNWYNHLDVEEMYSPASSTDPNHPDIVAFLEKVRSDPNLKPIIKRTLLVEMPSWFGTGRGRILC